MVQENVYIVELIMQQIFLLQRYKKMKTIYKYNLGIEGQITEIKDWIIEKHLLSLQS